VLNFITGKEMDGHFSAFNCVLLIVAKLINVMMLVVAKLINVTLPDRVVQV
jgi:hypothetical protein